jgi:hypothetical protein
VENLSLEGLFEAQVASLKEPFARLKLLYTGKKNKKQKRDVSQNKRDV